MRELVIGSYAFTMIVLAMTVLMWRGQPGQAIQAGIDRSIETSSIGPRAKGPVPRPKIAGAATSPGDPASRPQD